MSDRQRCEFTASQSGRHRQLVGQRSFDAEPLLPSQKRRIVLQPFPCEFNRIGKFIELQRLERPGRTAALLPRRGGLARCLDRFASKLRQRSQASHHQQPGQLRLGQCPALPTLIDFLIGMADFCERIEWQPIPLNAPVAETSQRNQVGVASPCPHRRLVRLCHRLLTEPAFDRFGSNVRQPSQAQFVDHSLNQPLGSGDVRLRPPGRLHRGDEFGEMIGQRRVLMIDHRILGGRDDPAPHLFGPLLQFGEHGPRRGFIPAARGELPDDALPVSKLCEVGRGLDRDPFLPDELPFGGNNHGSRSRPPFGVLPLGESLPFASEQLGPDRQRFRRSPFEDRSHHSPPSFTSTNPK
ncbi:MAG: hypothetical protein ACKV2Q_24915 [Planctomycetaceae bacterium]